MGACTCMYTGMHGHTYEQTWDKNVKCTGKRVSVGVLYLRKDCRSACASVIQKLLLHRENIAKVSVRLRNYPEDKTVRVMRKYSQVVSVCWQNTINARAEIATLMFCFFANNI